MESDIFRESLMVSTAGRKQSPVSGDIGKLGPIPCHTPDPCQRVVLQHQDYEGLVGNAVAPTPDPGRDAWGWWNVCRAV